MEGLDSGGQGPTSGCCAIEEEEEEEEEDTIFEKFAFLFVMSVNILQHRHI
jgi:hypothetical protein